MVRSCPHGVKVGPLDDHGTPEGEPVTSAYCERCQRVPRMSDEELRRVTDEIDGVARALFGALDNTAITVSEGSWEETDDEAAREDIRKLAAVAIDARDAQLRAAPARAEGASLIVGPAGLRPLRALLDGEGTPEQMEEYTRMLDAAIAADEATAAPEPPPHVGRNSNHGGPQEESPADRRALLRRENPELR